MDILNINFASNLKNHTKDLLGLWLKLQTQPSQDIRFLPLAQEVLTQILSI